jgi:peptidoglycan/xylan/chitin deacetylase (PgdA/CDA1 family)
MSQSASSGEDSPNARIQPSPSPMTLRKFGKWLVKNRISKWIQRRTLGVITHVETTTQIAALTFDDGPDPVCTPKLLDLLAKYDARATFFMVGTSARKYPDLVKRVAEAGHAVGNHTWNHPSLPSVSGRERRRQIRACRDAAGGFQQRLFRPPYGHLNLSARLDILRLNYKVITWNLVVDDWLDNDAVRMGERLIEGISPGGIVCLHDSVNRDRQVDGVPQPDRQQMLEAVEILLERLSGDFRFVTVPELLRHGRPMRRYWKIEKNDDWKSLRYRW